MTPRVSTFEEAGQRLTLRDLGTHHELLLGQVPILSSAALATERAFGELLRSLDLGAGPQSTSGAARGQAALRPGPRVLIGGLGFGATLAGALAASGEGAEILVAEKLETVVSLLRGELAHLSPGVLDDPRVRLLREDVSLVIERERDLDAILLDVDNGPGWASFRTNARLYAPEGLSRAREALRPNGVLAVWSGYPAEAFVGQLRRAGLIPTVIPLHERGQVRARAYVGRRQT